MYRETKSGVCKEVMRSEKKVFFLFLIWYWEDTRTHSHTHENVILHALYNPTLPVSHGDAMDGYPHRVGMHHREDIFHPNSPDQQSCSSERLHAPLLILQRFDRPVAFKSSVQISLHCGLNNQT